MGKMESVLLRNMIGMFKDIAHHAGQLLSSSHTATIASSAAVEVTPAIHRSAESRPLYTAITPVA